MAHFVATRCDFLYLHVEQEVHDVAILYHVVLAFGADEACFLGGVPAAVLQEVFVA